MLYAIGNKVFNEGVHSDHHEEAIVVNMPENIRNMLNPISNRSYDSVDLAVNKVILLILMHLKEHQEKVDTRAKEIEEWVEGALDERGKPIPKPLPIEKCDGVLITEDIPIYFHYHLVMYLRREGVPVYYVYRRPIWKDVAERPTSVHGTSEIVSEIVGLGNATLMDFNPVKRK